MTTPTVGELVPPTRLLLGPGPSMVHPRVLRAMSTPLLGHLDPKFLEIMNEVQALLRFVLRTQNPFTIAVSGTGSAGMEAALVARCSTATRRTTAARTSATPAASTPSRQPPMAVPGP